MVDLIKCEICGKENVKNMGAHKRFCPGVPKPAETIAEVLPPTVPETKRGRLSNALDGFKQIISDKVARLILLAQLGLVLLVLTFLVAGAWHLAGNVLVEMPFFWLSMVLMLVLVLVRKDIMFNVMFFVLKTLKRNPRIVYHVDGSKVLTRYAVSYNPATSSFKLAGKPALEVEVTPDALLTDGSYSTPAGLHVGGERSLRSLFTEAGDYFTAKQVDLMVKDAEQLGELKSTEKLDNLIKIGYIVAGAAILGVIVSVLTWSSVGELTASFDKVYPMLAQVPELLKNTLR